jgi:hypothetical protein
MKKRFSYQLILLFILLGCGVCINAQETNTFNYQAVVRNVNGDLLVNQNVSVLVSIIQGSETGAMVYSETHNATTDSRGLISLKIGEGTPVETYVFHDVDWSADKYFENSITQRNKSKIIDLLYGSKKVQKVKFKGASNYRNLTWRK